MSLFKKKEISPEQKAFDDVMYKNFTKTDLNMLLCRTCFCLVINSYALLHLKHVHPTAYDEIYPIWCKVRKLDESRHN